MSLRLLSLVGHLGYPRELYISVLIHRFLDIFSFLVLLIYKARLLVLILHFLFETNCIGKNWYTSFGTYKNLLLDLLSIQVRRWCDTRLEKNLAKTPSELATIVMPVKKITLSYLLIAYDPRIDFEPMRAVLMGPVITLPIPLYWI